VGTNFRYVREGARGNEEVLELITFGMLSVMGVCDSFDFGCR
jgi:hypothetical protein